MVEDDRRVNAVRQVIEFATRFFGGGSDDPTPEKPVTVQTTRDGKADISVKKVVDFGHEERVKRLAQQSMAIKAETEELLRKMAEDMKKKEGEDG